MKPHVEAALEVGELSLVGNRRLKDSDISLLCQTLREMDAALRLSKEALVASSGLVGGCQSIRIVRAHVDAKDAIEALL